MIRSSEDAQHTCSFPFKPMRKACNFNQTDFVLVCVSAADYLGNSYQIANVVYLFLSTILFFGFMQLGMHSFREANWQLHVNDHSTITSFLGMIVQLSSMIEATNLLQLRWLEPRSIFAVILAADIFVPGFWSMFLVYYRSIRLTPSARGKHS